MNTYTDFSVSNVFKLKNKYAFRVTLIYGDGTQKVQQKGGYEKKKDAQLARDKTVADLHSQRYVVDEAVRVGDFLLKWREDVIREESTASTYKTYGYMMKNNIIPVIGNIRLIDLNKGHINLLYKKIAVDKLSSAKLCRTIMKTSLRYAVGKKLIPENPAEGVLLPKVGKKKKEEYRTLTIKSEQTLTAEQLKVLIEKSHGTKIYLYILFAGLMGLRKSEILGLKYSDIDYSRQTIHVQRQLGTDLSKDQDQLPPKTKTKQEIHLKTKSSDRVLDMPDLVFNAVMEQRKRYEANRRRRPNDFQDLDYICCSSYGRPQSAAYVFQEFKRLLKESGLPDIRFHDLRHTYATLLMKDDIDVKAISNSLGHAKTLITVDVYGDKQEIISDCVDDIQVFIDEMIDDEDQHRNKDDHGQDNTFTDPDEEFSEDLISELTEQNKPISA